MHPTQTAILAAIKSNPNVTVRALQQQCSISNPALVQYHLNKMMADGVIKRGNKWVIVEKKK